MSFQVGAACFATVVDAGAAECARYQPVSTLAENGTVIRTVSCSSADTVTGALNLNVVSTPFNGTESTSYTVQQQLHFPACQEAAYVKAASVYFGAALGLWSVIWCGKKVIEMINWGRGETT